MSSSQPCVWPRRCVIHMHTEVHVPLMTPPANPPQLVLVQQAAALFRNSGLQVLCVRAVTSSLGLRIPPLETARSMLASHATSQTLGGILSAPLVLTVLAIEVAASSLAREAGVRDDW